MKRLFNILLSVHSNPFSVKVVITVVMFAAFSCLIVMLELRSYMTEVLIDELKQKGQAIASEAVDEIACSIQNGEVISLTEMKNNLSSKYEDIDYVMVLDSKGQIITHTLKENSPLLMGQTRNLPIRNLTHRQVDMEVLESENGTVFDFIVPMDENNPGWLRLGMSQKSILDHINSFSERLLLTTLLLTVIGVFGALSVAHLVTRPVTDLASASRKIAEGDYSQRVTTWGHDELAKLGHTFNLMASSIEKYSEEREALVEELKQNEQIRQELLKKVITAQEDERKRISRELHDETSQSLTSLMIGLKLLADEKLNERQVQTIADLKNLASSTLKEVHRLAVELRPTVLDDMGLIPAIERFIHGYSQNYNTDVDFHVQRKAQNRLPGEVETALYRIVQEALTNIAKYADAKNVSVLLDVREEGVKLIIEDDGCGFDVEKTIQSDMNLGIAGMKERTLLLNGRFTIESDTGQGTTIYVCIPLKRSACNEITDQNSSCG